MSAPAGLRLLVFNLATDADDPVLGFTSSWLRALAQRVAEVDVVTMRAGRIDLPANVRVHSLGKERGFGEPRRAARFYRLLGQVLRRRRPDACFSHMAPLFTVMAAPVLAARRVPVVTWYAHRQPALAARLAYHLSARIVTNAPEGFTCRSGPKVEVLGHGIDTARFAVQPPPPPGPPLVVSAGRLSPIKDLGTLVEAVARLGGVRAALVGEAPAHHRAYEAQLRALVARLGLDGAVSLPGPVRPHEVVAWYGQATAHVNLAPTGALDKAALEAMSCGRPSLVANEAFRPLLGRWADRLLVPAGDPAALADRLAWVLAQDGATRAAIGADLAAAVRAAHDLDGLADRLVALLSDLAGRRG